MDTDINKNSISCDEIQIHISYIESILENYRKLIEDIQKTNPDFCKHFIPDCQLEELNNYRNQLDEVETGILTLLPKISSEISLLPSYEYVTSIRNCLSGPAPEAIRLLSFLAKKDACRLEQKLMVSMDLKGKRLVEVTDEYNEKRKLLSNRAIYKAKFLRKTDLEKKNSIIKHSNSKELSGSSVKNRVTVGDTITFGYYPQEEDGEYRPIEWCVLAKEGERLLLISRYAIDCKRYNNICTTITWESCTLRKWLNSDFINKAFDEKEKALILEVTENADKNRYHSTKPGKKTNDKVFLLSISEAEKYFENDEDRKCVPTAYAVKQGVYTNDSCKIDGKPTCWWWLRSDGFSSPDAPSVRVDGSVCAIGHNVDKDKRVVRPALWINL